MHTLFRLLLLQTEVVSDLKPPAEIGLNGYVLFYTVVMLLIVMGFVLYMTRQHNQVLKDAQKIVGSAQDTVRLVNEHWRKDNEKKDERLDGIEDAIENHDRATSGAVRIVENLPQYIRDELTSTQNSLVKEILESRTQADRKLALVEPAIVSAVAEKVKEHIQPLRDELTAHYARLVEDVVKPPETI